MVKSFFIIFAALFCARAYAGETPGGRGGRAGGGEAGESSFIMEYLGEGEERARKLVEARGEITDPRGVFTRLMENVELFLRCTIVHGDLSPYNVLYHRGRAVVIDFPQASDPRRNPNAQALLLRDIRKPLRLLAKCAVTAGPEALFSEIWNKYQLNEI